MGNRMYTAGRTSYATGQTSLRTSSISNAIQNARDPHPLGVVGREIS
jgi:hypothetical protein